jgi:hypothetical protein
MEVFEEIHAQQTVYAGMRGKIMNRNDQVINHGAAHIKGIQAGCRHRDDTTYCDAAL